MWCIGCNLYDDNSCTCCRCHIILKCVLNVFKWKKKRRSRKHEGHPVIFDTGQWKMERDNESGRLKRRKAHFPLKLIRAQAHNYRTSAPCGFCQLSPSLQTCWAANRSLDYFQLFKGLFLSRHTSEVQTISNIHIPGDYTGTCLTGCLAWHVQARKNIHDVKLQKQ